MTELALVVTSTASAAGVAGRFIRGDVRGDGRFMVRMLGFGLPARTRCLHGEQAVVGVVHRRTRTHAFPSRDAVAGCRRCPPDVAWIELRRSQ